MKRKEFVQFFQQRLGEEKVDGRLVFRNGVSRKKVETILRVFFDCVLDVVGAGGEVRLKHGSFHPKLMQSQQQLVNVRLGFRSFSYTNRHLFEEFSKQDMPGIKISQFCEVFSTSGASRVVDDSGRELLSMTEISSMSGVSLPTCYRYVKQPWFIGPDGMANRLKLVSNNATGKRYDQQVADIFRLKKEENETKVKGKIDLPDGSTAYALSCVSRETGISIQSLHRIIRERQIPKITHGLLPDGRDFYDQEAVDRILEARRNQ